MHISIETSGAAESRLRRVIRAAELTVFEESYAFAEESISRRPPFSPDALAYVRDDEVWSYLGPSTAPSDERCRVFRFHFPPGVDNSGFVGWLASHLKRKCGTGVFV